MKVFDILNQFYSSDEFSFDLKFLHDNQNEISINNYISNVLRNIILSNDYKKCLDIGTLNGRSSMIFCSSILEKMNCDKYICLDKKLVFTIEKDEKKFFEAQKNFELNSMQDYIAQFLGDAKEILQTKLLDEKFDLIFIDADKASYPFYFEFAKKHLNENGTIIIDNIFLHKFYNEKYKETSNLSISLNKILNELKNRSKYQTLIIPYSRENSEDGLAIIKLI